MCLRRCVSLKKKRFQEDGYDLDLAYITDRVIAMGVPSVGMEMCYRNPADQTVDFLEERHGGKYMVYNLCSEKKYNYDPAIFGGAVRKFPFQDHNPCPMEMLRRLCQDMAEYLEQNPEHVIAVHCKAGKGRTGHAIAAWMVWDALAPKAGVAPSLGEGEGEWGISERTLLSPAWRRKA